MIKVKCVLLLEVFILIISVMYGNMTVQAETLQERTPMQAYVEAMQPGWNLGNTYDATGKDETVWGNPVVTKELIDAVASNGFKSIRLPVTWNQRLGDAPDYIIDPSFLEKIKQVVDWSMDAGMYVMLNMHHDTSTWIMKMETQHDETLVKYQAIWTQLSDYFGDYSDKLMFESVNEPRFSDDWGEDKEIYFTMLDELNTSFYDIVRSSPKKNNKTRPLVLPTIACAPAQARLDNLSETIALLNDPNIIATIHYYGYWHFSINMAGETMFGKNPINDVNTTFDRVYKTFVEKGIPVIIGEYGLLGFDKATDTIVHSEILKYFAYVGTSAKEKGMTVMLWDNGQHLDRRTLKWNDESMYETIIQSVRSPVAQAETEYIYVKADTEVKDAEIGISLNGDELTSIQVEGKELTAGTDYTLNGDKLVIYKKYIEEVLQRDFESNVKLTCEFKNSPDWNIYICYYDTPVLKNYGKLGSNFGIYTYFNGNKLITMEAKYNSGKGAGNQDWTTYKEFRGDFYPNYESKIITLTNDFIRSLRDEEITLTMHFLSGEKVDYYLVKKDGRVTAANINETEETTPDSNGETVDSDPQSVKTEDQTAEDIEETTSDQASLSDKASTPADSGAPVSAYGTMIFIVVGALVLSLVIVGIMVIRNKIKKG